MWLGFSITYWDEWFPIPYRWAWWETRRDVNVYWRCICWCRWCRRTVSGLTAGVPVSCALILCITFQPHAHCTHTHTRGHALAVDRQTCLSAMLQGPWLAAVKPALPPTKKGLSGRGGGEIMTVWAPDSQHTGHTHRHTHTQTTGENRGRGNFLFKKKRENKRNKEQFASEEPWNLSSEVIAIDSLRSHLFFFFFFSKASRPYSAN